MMNDSESVAEEPFRVPSDYSLEPELLLPSPRPIPEWSKQGRLAKGRRLGLNLLLVTGVVCLLLSRLPLTDQLALYFLPLAYLTWIAIGALALGLGLRLYYAVVPGPYRYIKDGIPLTVRILSLVKAPSTIVNGEASQHRFTAVLDLKHPDTGEHLLAETQSSEFSTSQKNSYDVTYRRGDYATALYLPGAFQKSLRLYGFLDLKPDFGLVRKQVEDEPLWKVILLVLAVVFLFFALFWNVYAYGRFSPVGVDFGRQLPAAAAGAILLGGGFLAWSFLAHRKEQRRQRESFEQSMTSGEAVELGASSFWGQTGWLAAGLKLIMIAGAPMLGGATALCWAYTANAFLDTSPVTERGARIEELQQATHAFIFREYQIKYRFAESTESRTRLSAPRELLPLFDVEDAVAEVRDGRFGWPWVAALRPADGAAPADAGLDSR